MRGVDEPGRHLLRDAFQRTGLTGADLWLRAFALGATVSQEDLDAFLVGERDLEPEERDLVAQAINARLDELHSRQRVPLTRRAREVRPEMGPLAALIHLMHGAHLAPPDALPRILDTAGDALGVRITLYLVDYGLSQLVPFAGGHGAGREPVGLEASMPGRAFRTMTTQSSFKDDQARMWIPVVDGFDRLGVIDVTLDDPREAGDPSLREHLWWVAHFAGHLLRGMGAYGDGIDAVRRTQPRTVEAELIWQLLPPPSAGTHKVVVSGRMEPSTRVGGDVFDYALSEHSADLAIIDATGHDLGAGLISAAALAAYRNARREGRTLFDQADAIHRTIAEQFGGTTFATGVVASLDLDSGRLRYIAAGHPYPLLVRNGRVVKTLRDGRRSLFGLEASRVSVGEEHLEPGDGLVLYTDGIIEARDGAGTAFGLPGLIDFIEREAAVETPLPEIVRRLCQAVLRRQEGELQDDCTVLLTHWTTERQGRAEPPGASFVG